MKISIAFEESYQTPEGAIVKRIVHSRVNEPAGLLVQLGCLRTCLVVSTVRLGNITVLSTHLSMCKKSRDNKSAISSSSLKEWREYRKDCKHLLIFKNNKWNILIKDYLVDTDFLGSGYSKSSTHR